LSRLQPTQLLMALWES